MRILPFRSARDIAAAVGPATEHLQAGGTLAYPTETVYGLGCSPRREDLASLARLKGRSEDKPFLLLVTGREMAEEWGLEFSDSAAALARAYWPGPLTLVLSPKSSKLPGSVRGPEGGVAVRWTGHRGIARLIEHAGHPITSTSANRPGDPPAPDVAKIELYFGDSENLLALDGGVLQNQVPSTLVDCTRAMLRVIREGAIPQSDLRSTVDSLAP
ncbi:MAG: L-threonylcarbamoyladenylate synthase [Gemmatimonadetes bacterium]|nr:L-threonylcarbamoyladenylate synthase [Gemmatimonadota bacterium]